MSSKRPQASRPKRNNKNIPISNSINLTRDKIISGLVRFSFKYHKRTEKFNLDSKDEKYQSKYLRVLLERLQEYCTNPAHDLMCKRSHATRCKRINFEKSTESCFGIKGEEQLVDHPFELNMSTDKYGRIHGFFIDDTFFVVWLDPDHKLFK